jgi:hypothetical protein
MDLALSPLSPQCCLTGRSFVAGERVVSYLGRDATGAVVRLDVSAEAEAREDFARPAVVLCRWVQAFKPRAAGENPERALKLTAESLFLALTDSANEPDEANVPLVRFLALMLERKRVLKPRGRTPDGAREVYEHAGTRQRFEVPAGELTVEFFRQIQEHLGVLVGEPKAVAPAAPAEAAGAPGERGAG